MADLLTVEEVAAELSLSELGVLRLVEGGELQGTREGDSPFGRVKFSRAAVDAYAARRQERGRQ